MPSKDGLRKLINIPQEELDRWRAALLVLTAGASQADSEAIRQAVYAAAEAKRSAEAQNEAATA